MYLVHACNTFVVGEGIASLLTATIEIAKVLIDMVEELTGEVVSRVSCTKERSNN